MCAGPTTSRPRLRSRRSGFASRKPNRRPVLSTGRRRWLLGDGAARRHDLLLGGGRDLVDRDRELHADVALTENLDLLVLPDGTLGDEVAARDLTTLGVQLGDLLQVHDLVLDPERVLEP